MNNDRKMEHVMRLCDDHDFIDKVAMDYAEPGYATPKLCIVTGDWNNKKRYDSANNKFITTDDTPSKVAKKLELLGCELEWLDEWDECCECDKLVRTSPDSYGWTRSYFENDGEITCHECVKADPSFYIDWLIGNPARALTFDVDLTAHGFVKFQDGFERGLHHDQADDPRKIATALEAKGIDRFIFELDSASQFDISFSVWIDKDQVPAELLEPSEVKSDESPASIMERGLRNAAMTTAEPGVGPVVTTIDMETGEATAKRYSPEEFARGIK